MASKKNSPSKGNTFKPNSGKEKLLFNREETLSRTWLIRGTVLWKASWVKEEKKM